MEHLPIYVNIVFILTTLLTVFVFYKAANYSIITLIILLAWLALQAIIGITGFYSVTKHIPPRFIFLILPPLVFIILLFATTKGRQFIDGLDEKSLILLHMVRIPVEIVLYSLFIYKAVPQLMTFEGRNFDILSGITAPVVFYFGYINQQFSRKVILVWNFLCLGLLINIVAHAILSAPFPFQKLAFEQPNIALLYFPFIWLPCCVVPLVLFSHLVVIRRMVKRG